MDVNKNIDKFVKQKLEKRTFEYQDSFWEDAEQIIVADENRRNKRRGLLFWVLGFTICLAGGGLWLQTAQLTRSQVKIATNNTTYNILHNHENTSLPIIESSSIASLLSKSTKNDTKSLNVESQEVSNQSILGNLETESTEIAESPINRLLNASLVPEGNTNDTDVEHLVYSVLDVKVDKPK